MDLNFTDYGNGVYFIGHNGDEFGAALSQFIDEHSDLKIVAISGKDSATIKEGIRSGFYTAGYFIITVERW